MLALHAPRAWPRATGPRASSIRGLRLRPPTGGTISSARRTRAGRGRSATPRACRTRAKRSIAPPPVREQGLARHRTEEHSTATLRRLAVIAMIAHAIRGRDDAFEGRER